MPKKHPVLACELVEPAQDHTFWAEDFGHWALARCFFHDRSFSGVKALHLHFCEWCIAEQTVGCNLPTFEALLADERFLLGGGMVAGLILGEDWEALQSPPPPQAKTKPG